MSLSSSPLSHGGHRDDRRRRLLADDHSTDAESAAVSEKPARPGRAPRRKSANYGEGEFLQDSLRLTDLVPRRILTFVLLLALGIGAIAGLAALHIWSPRFASPNGMRDVMFELGGSGSLGAWVSSLLLLGAAVFAFVTYNVRRHKLDDYHGRYGIWLWAAAGWFLLATDSAATLHPAVQRIAVALTKMKIVGDGSIWWFAPAVLLLGAIGSRLLVDMWSSRLSSAALILAALAYMTAALGYCHVARLASDVHQVLLVQVALLAGHLLLAAAMGLHARYVILDAQGLIARKPAKAKRDKAASRKAEKAAADAAKAVASTSSAASNDEPSDDDSEDEADDDSDSDDKWVAVDPPHATAPPVLKRVPTAGSSTATSPAAPHATFGALANPSQASAATSDAADKLSKNDRKALKKKLLDERLKREQKKASHW